MEKFTVDPTTGLPLFFHSTERLCAVFSAMFVPALGTVKAKLWLLTFRLCEAVRPVSYTHLTLPTTERV